MKKGSAVLSKIPGIFWGILLVSVLFSFTAKNFTNPLNIENVLKNTSVLLIISIGATMAILSGKSICLSAAPRRFPAWSALFICIRSKIRMRGTS